MRIARILTRLNLGGPARQALACDPWLRRSGHTVRLFTGTPEHGEGDLFDTFTERGHDLVRIASMRRGVNPARDWRAKRALVRALAEFEPELVHTHASKAGSLGRAAVESLPDSATIGRVHTFHGHVFEGYFPELVARRLVAHETRQSARTDRVLAVSHATADDLVRLGVVGENKLVVVPPGIELEPLLEIRRGHEPAGGASRLRDLIGARPDEVVVGAVGRLAEVKRPGLALDVFELLRERFPHFHLVFVGDGPERRGLEARIGALDAEGQRRVHLVGAYTDMRHVWPALDLVLMTSRTEGMPVALIEAGAAGLPVVATPVGGIEELVVHERTGMIGATVEELAFGLSQLLERRDERLACGQRARTRVASRHGGEKLAERLAAVYAAVLAERHPGRASELPGASGS